MIDIDYQKVKKIADHYGIKNQIEKTKEELAELNLALIRGEDVTTEIADVYIMLNQLVYLMGNEFETIIEVSYKLDRQIARIEQEEQNVHEKVL